MSCSYCEMPAKCKCVCSKPYMCVVHLGEHLVKNDKHSFEKLDIDIGESELLQLRNKIIEKIKQIELAKKELHLQTKLLLKEILIFHKDADEQLNKFISSYNEILHLNRFCSSQMPKIKEIRNSKISARISRFDDIKDLLERYYPSIRIQDQQILIIADNDLEKLKRDEEKRIIKEARKKIKEKEKIRKEEKRKKKEEEVRCKKHFKRIGSWDLKTKITYFHPIIKAYWKTWTFDLCINEIKEILLSNDKQYFFVCI